MAEIVPKCCWLTSCRLRCLLLSGLIGRPSPKCSILSNFAMSRKRQKTTHGNFTASNGNSYTRPPPLTLQDALSEFSEALEVAAKLGEGLMIELLMGWAEELRLKWAYMRDSRSLDKSPDQVNERQNGYRDVGHHDLSDDAMRDDGDETVSENEEENDELYGNYDLTSGIPILH